MKISLEHISKRFLRYWIFKNINCIYETPGRYAILGANGSGKSTLMRIIAGMQNASAGKMLYELNGQKIEVSKVFPLISYAAPGMEIVEEMSLSEFLEFHFSFKKILPSLTISEIIKEIGLEHASDKHIGDFSSGMKQRVKLAQAIFADTPVLLLDEPCSNLDDQGVAQYRSWMERFTENKLVIVASNDVREYFFCTERIDMNDYK